MHYQVAFTGNKAQKETQARNATIEYLGLERYMLITGEAAKAKTWRETVQIVRFACGMAGVGGYWPFRAMLRDALANRVEGRKHA